MGEILPDGRIQGYAGYCPLCKAEMEMNIQGDGYCESCNTHINIELRLKLYDNKSYKDTYISRRRHK